MTLVNTTTPNFEVYSNKKAIVKIMVVATEYIQAFTEGNTYHCEQMINNIHSILEVEDSTEEGNYINFSLIWKVWDSLVESIMTGHTEKDTIHSECKEFRTLVTNIHDTNTIITTRQGKEYTIKNIYFEIKNNIEIKHMMIQGVPHLENTFMTSLENIIDEIYLNILQNQYDIENIISVTPFLYIKDKN